MERRIEIVKVAHVAVENQDLVGFNLDAPQTGEQQEGTSIEFRGWVLGKTSPVIAVEVVSQGRVLKTIAINVPRPDVVQIYPQIPFATVSGFQAKFEIKSIIFETEPLTVYAILRDQTTIPLAELTLKCISLSSLQEMSLPQQQSSQSEIESLQLKLQRIQADLERSKVFVEKIKTDNLKR